MAKYLYVLLVLISFPAWGEVPFNLTSGTCEEIKEGIEFSVKPASEGAGEVRFGGYQGVVALFCDGSSFKSAMFMFTPNTVEEAGALYSSLESALIDEFGNYDEETTREYASMLYLSNVLVGKAGLTATTSITKWGKTKDNLELVINNITGDWVVVVTFGGE